jgi:hypothetical protein
MDTVSNVLKLADGMVSQGVSLWDHGVDRRDRAVLSAPLPAVWLLARQPSCEWGIREIARACTLLSEHHTQLFTHTSFSRNMANRLLCPAVGARAAVLLPGDALELHHKHTAQTLCVFVLIRVDGWVP